ncbi:hypothetical protein QFZ94_007652 [Paraburkholderia sp. JPY465]
MRNTVHRTFNDGCKVQSIIYWTSRSTVFDRLNKTWLVLQTMSRHDMSDESHRIRTFEVLGTDIH